MAQQKVNTGQQVTVLKATDPNGWTVHFLPDGKKKYTKSGTVTGLSLPAGLSFVNGNITSMPVGLTGANLWSSSYIVTEALILSGTARHIIPHTIFDDSSTTMMSYGLINTWTGGTWSGSMGYNYSIEEV